MSRRARLLACAIASLAATFAGLAALRAAGHFDRLDRYAVEHLMPALDPGELDHGRLPSWVGLFWPFDLDALWWENLLDVALYPASALVSGVVFGAAFLVLWHRRLRWAALVWGCSWFTANGIELVLKLSLSRPDFSAETPTGPVHPSAFGHAFPSGHTMRAVMLVGLVWCVWRRFGWIVFAWAALVPPLLVVAGHHVPADVIGGVVFGLLVVGTTYLLAELPAPASFERRAS